MRIIIEGIDNIGKGTVIKEIQDQLGFHQEVKYSKPKKLEQYNGDIVSEQVHCYHTMFDILNSCDRIICDRGHLGEYVYSNLYRGYDGHYIYTIEELHDTADIKLVLLTTSNMNIRIDDGKSFDHNKGLAEQELFIDAFNKSGIRDKIMIDVHNGNGNFKNVKGIVKEILEKK